MDSIAKIDCILTKKGISGSKMASDIGLSNSIYSQWNSRKVKPSPKSLIKIANYLDVEVDEILADTEELTTPSSESEKEQKNKIVVNYNDLDLQKDSNFAKALESANKNTADIDLDQSISRNLYSQLPKSEKEFIQKLMLYFIENRE